MRSIPCPAYQSLLNPIQQCNTGCALPLIKHSTRQSFDMDSWRCTMLEDKRAGIGDFEEPSPFPTRCEKCCFVMFSLCIRSSLFILPKSGPLEKNLFDDGTNVVFFQNFGWLTHLSSIVHSSSPSFVKSWSLFFHCEFAFKKEGNAPVIVALLLDVVVVIAGVKSWLTICC